MDLGNFCSRTMQLWDNILGMDSYVKCSSAEAVWMMLALRTCCAVTEIIFYPD